MSELVVIDVERFLTDTDDLPVGIQALYLLFVVRALGEPDPMVDNDGLCARRMGLTTQHWLQLKKKVDHLIRKAEDGRLVPLHGLTGPAYEEL